MSDWKERLGMVYSTNPDFEYTTTAEPETETPAPETLVKDFVGSDADLQELGRMLKSKCGVGGSAKDGEIISQGDHRDRVVDLLTKAGYRCKKAGG